jgi:hypothetical protein
MTDADNLLELAAARLTLAIKDQDRLRALGRLTLAQHDLAAAIEHLRVEAAVQEGRPVLVADQERSR